MGPEWFGEAALGTGDELGSAVVWGGDGGDGSGHLEKDRKYARVLGTRITPSENEGKTVSYCQESKAHLYLLYPPRKWTRY